MSSIHLNTPGLSYSAAQSLSDTQKAQARANAELTPG